MRQGRGLDSKVAHFNYSALPYAVRPEIGEAYRAFWHRLAGPGSWWTGEERVAIAEASRLALTCDYCRERKDALSPYNFKGEHTHSDVLPEIAVDAVHRVITDQSRITRQWIQDNAGRGLSKEAYVELVGITVVVFSIDEFNRALGLALESLPPPRAGEPDNYRPSILSEDMGFVPTIPPEGATGRESDLWSGRAANVMRALSLVPEAVRDWYQVSGAQYLSIEAMANLIKDKNRSINRMQMELIAGRVSAVNQCFY